MTDEAGTEVLTPEHCDASSRPQESDSCAQPECPAAVPDMRTHWESAEWSEVGQRLRPASFSGHGFLLHRVLSIYKKSPGI